MVDTLLNILVEFGGGRGAPENTVVRFLLASFFWAQLAFAAYFQLRKTRERRDAYILIAALFGMTRELTMFAAEYGSHINFWSYSLVFQYYPPFEHALTMLSGLLIGYAFLHYFFSHYRFINTYLVAGSITIIMLFVIIAPAWIDFLHEYPDTLFGAFWGDMAFRVVASILMVIVLLVFAHGAITGISVSLFLWVGMTFLFLDEFLMIFNLATNEIHIAIFAPVRHNLHIWAIPFFVAVYWLDLKHQSEKSALKTEAIIAALGDGLSIHDRDFRVTYQNPQHRKIMGDVIGHFCYEAFHGKSEICEDCEMAPMFRDGKVHVHHTYYKSRDMHAEVTVSPLTGPDGQIIAGIELIRDRSELESSRTQLTSILEIAQDAIISINELQHIIIFNKGAEATFGYSEEEMFGKPLDILIPEKSRKAHRTHVNNFAKSEVDTNQMGPQMNLFGRHKNGSTFPIEATISKLLSNGTIVFTVILRDISIRKNIEKQLQDHSILLEQAVEQKTIEMQSLTERLVRQEKLATVGQISANIAHELRNPLGAIKQVVFYLGRLIEKGEVDKFNEKIDGCLKLINSELDIGDAVITNLLDATRSKSLSPVLVDLEKLTHEAVNSSRLLSMLDIQFQLEPNPFFVFVDVDQFRQVIINLLTNVSQTGKQGVQATVRARVLLDINQTLIQVEDNGPGIEAGVIDKVFEPLFTTRQMGIGLGLSICKQIVENHCGTIVLSNKKAQGTVVEIQLPMSE